MDIHGNYMLKKFNGFKRGYVRRQGYGTPSGFTVCCACNTPGTLHCVCDPGLITCNLSEVIMQRKDSLFDGYNFC